MQAIILAGGKGTRLQPYTAVLPKPLMPVGEKPILEIVIKQLKMAGCNEVVITVGHLAELIQAYFGDGRKWGVKVRYSKEDNPLGTAGPLSLVRGMRDNFIVMNGDILTDINYSKLMSFHKSRKSTATVAVYDKNVKIELGVLKIDDRMRLRDYIEKPTFTYQVSMGVYAFRKEVLRYIPKNEYYDFPNLIKKLIEQEENVGVFRHKGYWLDIGRREDYELALNQYAGKEKTS